MRRRLAPVIFFSAVALPLSLLSGCGGGGTTAGGGGTSPTPVQSNDFTLAPNAVPLEAAGATVVSATDATVVLQGAPALSPGQILVHNAPNADAPDAGFVRKVVSSVVSGSTTTVTTAPAGIADVFAGKVNIDGDTDFAQEDLNRLRSDDPTIAISPNLAGRAPSARRRAPHGRGTDAGAVDLKFTDTPVKNASGATVATLNGTMTVGGGVTGALVGDAPLNIQRFELSPYLNVYGRLNVRKTGAGSVAAEMPITQPLSLQQTAFGNLKGTVKMQLFVKLDGNGPDGTTVDVAADVTGKAGFAYTPAGGFTGTSDLRRSLSMTSPKTDAAAYELGASFARSKFDIAIPGLGTASATSDVVRAVALSSATTTPKAGFNSQGFGEFSATGGAKVGFQGVALYEGQKTVAIPRFAISNLVFYPSGGGGDGGDASTSQILYIAPNGREIRTVSPDGTLDRSVVTARTDYLGRPSAQRRLGSLPRQFVYVASSGQNPGLFVKTVDTADGPSRVDVGSLIPLDAAYFPTGGAQVFSAQDSSTHQQLYSVDATGIRQLTTTGTDHQHPVFSPEGEYVYYDFYRNGKYGVGRVGMRLGSSEEEIVFDATKTYQFPKISFDGTLGLAIQPNVGVVVFAIGSTPNPRVVIADPSIIAASFSPDGKQIVVGTETYSGTVRTGSLNAYPVAGGTGRFIVNGFAPEWTGRP